MENKTTGEEMESLKNVQEEQEVETKETWTDDEMKERLESMGYDVTDDEGEVDTGLLAEVASMTEGYKWDEEKEVWHN